MIREAVCSIVRFYNALAASNRENMSRSRRGRANSPEVWGQQKHSGDGRSWRIDDDLEVDRDTRCPTTIPVLRKCQVESELDIPFMVVARRPISYGACLATRRRVPSLSKWGRRVELAFVQGDSTSRCHRFFSQTQRRHFFPPPNSTNRGPTVPLMSLFQIHHHGLCRPVLHTHDDV